MTTTPGMLPHPVAEKALFLMQGHKQISMLLTHNTTGLRFTITLQFDGAVTVFTTDNPRGEAFATRAAFAEAYGVTIRIN